MTRRLFYAAIIAFITSSSLVFGQEKDFGIWYNVGISTDISKNIELDISGAVRTFENASRMDEGFGELGFTFKVIKNLSIGAKYRLTEKLEDNGTYYPRHKWIGDIKGGFDIGRFQISERLRIQRQDKTYFEDANDEIPDYYLRCKFKATYKTRSFPLNPYASFESFSRIFEAADKKIEKYRIGIGLDYKISKKHSVEAEYMFQRDHQPSLSDLSILGIGYGFKF